MPQLPPRRQNDIERDRPGKSLRQQLQELANSNIVEAARSGFAEIDRHAGGIKDRLKQMGIANADDFVDELATKVKGKAAELMTGRAQGTAAPARRPRQ